MLFRSNVWTRGRRVSTLLLAGIAVLGTTGAVSQAAPALPTAFVRVNQVGYPSAADKRAYVMSSTDLTGTTFTVRNGSNQVVLTGNVGESLGSWSRAYSFVHPIDFKAVTTPGTYTVAISGPPAATSPPFRIDTGPNVYGDALANALFFYQTESDGPDFIPAPPLRTAPAHLNDQNAMTYLTPNANSSGRFSGDLMPLGLRVDASGGWWDAGDYIKGVETLGYTTAMLLHGARELPAQMAAGASDFTTEAKFGTDWLLRMWDDSTSTFYYQVGIGTGNAKTVGDHDIWRLPQADDTFGGTDPAYRYIRNRPVFRAGAPGSPISPNLAGRDAAVFGLCYQLFKDTDPAFANRCLLAGVHIFDLADTNPRQLITYAPYSFYPETEWRSDLELGATELYLALTSGGDLPDGLAHPASYYLQQAAHWASAYIGSPDDAADTLNLYDVSGLAHYELYKAIAQAGNPSGLEVTHAQLLADLKKALDGAVSQASGDPFQFGFPWATWDTTSHGAGLVVMASEYDQLTGTETYKPWSSRWLANILGANAWGVSLIVGDGTTFPHCIHHQVANLVGSLDGSGAILRGAAVEGPNGTLYTGFESGMQNCPADNSDQYAQFNSKAKFRDDIESFSTVEPAVDLTATSPLAFARLAAGLH